MGKLTWTHYGLILLAGLTGFACSQEAREPVEVGTTQVELRSDLVLPETPGSSTELLDEEKPVRSGQSTNPVPTLQRYEFLPKDPGTQKSSAHEGGTHAESWTLADKHWVRAGKGFGVAAEGMAPSGSVHLDDASYYSPTVALKPYPKVSEHLEPEAGLFKSRKPLVFHSGATGFAHEPWTDAMPSGHSPAFETEPELSPVPETQVSFKPKTRMPPSPAKNRLDLMNGNENLNRDRFYKYRQKLRQ